VDINKKKTIFMGDCYFAQREIPGQKAREKTTWSNIQVSRLWFCINVEKKMVGVVEAVVVVAGCDDRLFGVDNARAPHK
jgi:hypothetical protein